MDANNFILVLRVILFLLLFLQSGVMFGQTSVNSSGGLAEGLGGESAYSFGQVFFEVWSNENNSLAEGVQQPYEVSIPENPDKDIDIGPIIVLYPNPTAFDFNLLVETEDIGSLELQLYDSLGRLLLTTVSEERITTFSFMDFSAGTYFLTVKTPDGRKTSHRIIKI